MQLFSSHIPCLYKIICKSSKNSGKLCPLNVEINSTGRTALNDYQLAEKYKSFISVTLWAHNQQHSSGVKKTPACVLEIWTNIFHLKASSRSIISSFHPSEFRLGGHCKDNTQRILFEGCIGQKCNCWTAKKKWNMGPPNLVLLLWQKLFSHYWIRFWQTLLLMTPGRWRYSLRFLLQIFFQWGTWNYELYEPHYRIFWLQWFCVGTNEMGENVFLTWIKRFEKQYSKHFIKYTHFFLISL